MFITNGAKIRKNDDEKESVKQYIKEKYLENGTSNIAYKKAKYQENSEVRLLYQCRYQENPESENNISKSKVPGKL